MSEEHQSEPARLRVRLEGWRFLGHSYSFVHQWQALELSRRSNCLVGMRDLPALPAVTKWNGPPWKRLHNIFDASDEARLAEFSDIAAPDAVVRMAFPISFRGEPAARTFVFAPGDTGWCPRILIEGNEELREAHARSEVVLLTPSKWSAWGLLRAGADPRRVAVVPHGVAPEIFCPAPDEIRQQLRQQLNWKDRFIFLNVSALTFNKGIDILLRSFARIAERFPNVVLALKGNDEIYPSADVLQHIMQTTLTAGGPTDDFLQDGLGFRVPAKIVKADLDTTTQLRDQREVRLLPDVEQLTAIMESMVRNQAAAEHARIAGPAFVRDHFTWRHAIDRLLGVVSCYSRPASTWPTLQISDPASEAL